jgi:hypothetical protein
VKVEINANGQLVITAEIGIESFALRRLAGEIVTVEDHEYYPAQKLVINHSIERGAND